MTSSIQLSNGNYLQGIEKKSTLVEIVYLFQRSPNLDNYRITSKLDHISFKIGDFHFVKLYTRNITYLGNPHPQNKKRFQLPNKWNKLLHDPKCLLTGVYSLNDNLILVILFNPNHIKNKNNQSSVHVSVEELRSTYYQSRHYKKDKKGNEYLMVNLSEFECFLEYLKSIFNDTDNNEYLFEKILGYFRDTKYHLNNILQEFSISAEFLKSNIPLDNVDLNQKVILTHVQYLKICNYFHKHKPIVLKESNHKESQNILFYNFIKECIRKKKTVYQITTELCEKFNLSFDESIQIIENYHEIDHDSEQVLIENNRKQEEIFHIGKSYLSKGKSSDIKDQFVRWFSTDYEIRQGSNAFNLYRGISSARFLDRSNRNIAFFIFSSSSYTKAKNHTTKNNLEHNRINIYIDEAFDNSKRVDYMGDGRPGKEWYHHHNQGNNQIINIIRTQLIFPPIFYFDRPNKGELKFLGIYKPVKIEIIKTSYNSTYYSNLKITISRVEQFKSISASWIKSIREKGRLDDLYMQMSTSVNEISDLDQFKI